MIHSWETFLRRNDQKYQFKAALPIFTFDTIVAQTSYFGQCGRGIARFYRRGKKPLNLTILVLNFVPRQYVQGDFFNWFRPPKF